MVLTTSGVQAEVSSLHSNESSYHIVLVAILNLEVIAHKSFLYYEKIEYYYINDNIRYMAPHPIMVEGIVFVEITPPLGAIFT